MLDVLTAIKNNNVNRIPNYDPALAEHLRKILRTLCVNGKYVTTLNISSEDLVNAQNRGKWWVVGSAWTGNINDISSAVKSSSTKKDDAKYSEQLLELARKQRMNTDERRNVFCILMSAEVSIKNSIFFGQQISNNCYISLELTLRIISMHSRKYCICPSRIIVLLFQLSYIAACRKRLSTPITRSLLKDSVITIGNIK